jgi:hypothetical protein
MPINWPFHAYFARIFAHFRRHGFLRMSAVLSLILNYQLTSAVC